MIEPHRGAETAGARQFLERTDLRFTHARYIPLTTALSGSSYRYEKLGMEICHLPTKPPRFYVDSVQGMQARFVTGTVALGLPEARDLVAMAQRYVAGKCGIVRLYASAVSCLYWANIYGVHPTIRALAYDWALLAEQVEGLETWAIRDEGRVWDMFTGVSLSDLLPETVLYERVLADLGGAAPQGAIRALEDR